MSKPYAYLGGYMSGSPTPEYPITNGRVYDIFNTASEDGANVRYETGSTAAQLFPTYSIEKLGIYKFETNFKITSLMSGSGRSGSYIFNIYHNNDLIYSTQSSHTASSETFESRFREFNIVASTANILCAPDDIIVPQLFVTGTSVDGNFTASLSPGVFFNTAVLAANTYTLLYNSASSGYKPYISGSTSAGKGRPFDVIVLSEELTNTLDSVIFRPDVISGSIGTSSLYGKYGDVDYDFSLNPYDFFTFRATNQSGISQYFEYVIQGTEIIDNKLHIALNDNMPGFLAIPVYTTSSFDEVVFLKRIKDETAVYLAFNKREGDTSYGLIIPNNIHPDVIDNIDNITRETNTKLIETSGEQ